MTIESTNANASYRYQINKKDSSCVDRKENKPHARWELCYARYANAEIARANMLRLGKKEPSK